MSNNSKLIFYNNFHSSPRLQKRLIDINNFTYKNIIHFLNNTISNHRIETALDYGCGVGSLTLYLAKHCKQVDAYDLSNNALKIARNNAKHLLINNVRFLSVFNFTKLRNKYDLVVCSEVIEHIKNDSLVINMLSNSLKKGGYMFISVPNIKYPQILSSIITKHDINVGHLRRYSKNTINRRFSLNKLKIKKIIISDGLIRILIFYLRTGSIIAKIANKVPIIGNSINYIDNLLVGLFGGAQLIVVAKKE